MTILRTATLQTLLDLPAETKVAIINVEDGLVAQAIAQLAAAEFPGSLDTVGGLRQALADNVRLDRTLAEASLPVTN